MEYLGYAAPFLVFAVLFAFAIAVGALSRLKEDKRSERLMALAEQVGWRFVGDHDPTYHDERSAFSCFYTGHPRFAHNQMQGLVDVITNRGEKLSLPFEAGDYHYCTTSRSGSSNQRRTDTYRFSYLIVDTLTDNSFLSVLAKQRRPRGYEETESSTGKVS